MTYEVKAASSSQNTCSKRSKTNFVVLESSCGLKVEVLKDVEHYIAQQDLPYGHSLAVLLARTSGSGCVLTLCSLRNYGRKFTLQTSRGGRVTEL